MSNPFESFSFCILNEKSFKISYKENSSFFIAVAFLRMDFFNGAKLLNFATLVESSPLIRSFIISSFVKGAKVVTPTSVIPYGANIHRICYSD